MEQNISLNIDEFNGTQKVLNIYFKSTIQEKLDYLMIKNINI